MHVETAGNPNGQPVLFLHGGPGAGINGNYKWPFNPDQYFIVAFDQRGCGNSSPFGSLENNTTKHLIDDIEALRKHLQIQSWTVFGGSWGATLALCYAIAHPTHVKQLVLRGVFLARQQDFDWFLQANGGAAQVYPDAYEDFISQVANRTERPNMRSAQITQRFYDKFASENTQVSTDALNAWFNWEGAISKLLPDSHLSAQTASNQQVKSLALLECHYLQHQCFIPENYILDNVQALSNISTHIVHGRYDMVCKVAAAYELNNALRNSQLFIVDNAGHSASEKGIKAKLISIMNDLAKSPLN
ncbi:prolyl aminopeptidase [Ningiella sp. W23]|uniref:prolyl aminopeptidase n=1 Tax=Ningiella sp. W23 TaxID=3023715 RepID=UPI003757BFE9